MFKFKKFIFYFSLLVELLMVKLVQIESLSNINLFGWKFTNSSCLVILLGQFSMSTFNKMKIL